MRTSVLALLGILSVGAIAASPPPGGWTPPPAKAMVQSVYDGDTVTLETGDKVRLRWVNAPEMKPEEPYAREAKALTTSLVGGREVDLDVGPEGRDGYGRILAGLSVPEGTLSVALLEAGLGHLFIIPPEPSDLAPLIAAQDRARAARRGIWSTEAFEGAAYISSFHNNGAGDDEAKPEGEYLRICNISAGPLDLSGWKIRNSRGEEFKIPRILLPVGFTFTLHSGRGDQQTQPTKSLTIFLGTDRPIWDDERDTAELINPEGRVVARRSAGH